MKSKNLGLLLVLTVAVAGTAYVTVQGRGPSDSSAAEQGKLFATLEDKVNDVTEVHVERGGEATTLRLEGDRWGVVQRGSYPAEFDDIKKLVLQLAQLEIEEPKTQKPENYEALGVQDPDAEGSESARVTLRGKDGTELASVIVGDPLNRGRSPATYVRKNGALQAFLCSGRITVDPAPTNWIDRSILEVESKNVTRVTIAHPDGEVVEIEKLDPTSSQFKVRDVPDGRQLSYEGAGNSIGTVLSRLTLEDVRPVDEVDFSAAPLARTSVRLFDGQLIIVELAEFEDQTWARFQTRYEAPPEKAAPPEPVEDEDGETAEDEDEDPGDDAAAVAAAVQARVEEQNARWTLWAYALPSYKADNLAKRMEDLLGPPAEDAGVDDGSLPLDGPALEDLLGPDEPNAVPADGAATEPEGDSDEAVEPPVDEAPTDAAAAMEGEGDSETAVEPAQDGGEDAGGDDAGVDDGR